MVYRHNKTVILLKRNDFPRNGNKEKPQPIPLLTGFRPEEKKDYRMKDNKTVILLCKAALKSIYTHINHHSKPLLEELECTLQYIGSPYSI